MWDAPKDRSAWPRSLDREWRAGQLRIGDNAVERALQFADVALHLTGDQLDDGIRDRRSAWLSALARRMAMRVSMSGG